MDFCVGDVKQLLIDKKTWSNVKREVWHQRSECGTMTSFCSRCNNDRKEQWDRTHSRSEGSHDCVSVCLNTTHTCMITRGSMREDVVRQGERWVYQSVVKCRLMSQSEAGNITGSTEIKPIKGEQTESFRANQRKITSGNTLVNKCLSKVNQKITLSYYRQKSLS